jgi:hypothetical protein
MSDTWGKPVLLTKGERRLLLSLVREELARLEQPPGAPPHPRDVPAHGGRCVGWLRALRHKQYRRIALELELARAEAPERHLDDPEGA